MRQSNKPFVVEIRSPRLKARAREHASIWANVDIAGAFEKIEDSAVTGLTTVLSGEPDDRAGTHHE
jgi:hypothetical protein